MANISAYIDEMAKLIRVEFMNFAERFGIIVAKNATIASYNEDTKKATVYFQGDFENESSPFFNRSGKKLQTGDKVVVFHLFGKLAQGWIANKYDVSGSEIIPIEGGGTGASTVKEAKENLEIPILNNFETLYFSGLQQPPYSVLASNWTSLKPTDSGVKTYIITISTFFGRASYWCCVLSNGTGYAIELSLNKNAHIYNFTETGTYTSSRMFIDSDIIGLTNGGTGASDAEGARTNLGLGVVATEDILPVSKGGTGATSFPSDSFLLGNGTSAFQAKTADEVVTLLGAVKKPVLLWENASPTSSFAEQTVSLNLSAYDFFLVAVLAASNNSNTSYNIGAKSPLNYSDGNTCLAAESYDMHAYRRAKFYDDRIEFYGANKFSSTNASGDNSKAIPYKIWGFKQ